MEAFGWEQKYDDNDEKALKGLSEAFASFSLEDITSAYYKADRNADSAGEILCNMQGSTSSSSAFATNGEARGLESAKPSYGEIYVKTRQENGKFGAPKQKWRPVSGGTVSSIIGKDYVRPVPAVNGDFMGTKPVKLDANEFPMSELWREEPIMNPSKNGHMQKDMEDFIFRMLGDGFQLERDLVHQILDKCGFDMQKSVEKLLDMSTATSDEGNSFPIESTEKIAGVHSNSEKPTCIKGISQLNSCAGGNWTSNITERKREEREKNDLQKEVLVALFNSTDRAEGLARRKARAAKRSTALGELVVEPPRDYIRQRKSNAVELKQDNDNNEDEEDNYQKLRKAVKEYRVTMKEYYKSAVEAFGQGDHDRANKLMDEGHFFHEKAREADQESSQKIFETKNGDTRDELVLDVHDHGAKEAMRLLKCHLSSLAGIAAIKHLKVIIETDDEDTSKGARRRFVKKLLEKESIEWTEGGISGTILIRLDNINRKGLSFAKR
ncbi:putative nuclear RNA export factor SDE5 isoform X2 [Mercurialis annua]|nr:putative nuclear RNA export factor SDE5 isoform X2 [Mercurialis annua]XP_050214014.1 putative nuclear RNA export factor SDE5 isoform X2 [Mercurialis annua]